MNNLSFIKLTQKNDKSLYLNLDQVYIVREDFDGSGQVISTNGFAYNTREKVEEIMAIITKECYKGTKA